MEKLVEIAGMIFEQYGYAGIFFLTALEQFIFPVPADVFVAMGTSLGFPFKSVLLMVLLGALVGSLVGYFLGKWLGHPVLAWLLRKKRMEKAEKFIERWGVWGVILAALTPLPFKIITVTAGALEMPLSKYMIGVLVGRMPRYLITAYAGTLIYETKFYASTEMSAVILGGIQGVTEFLPISSSGHLAVMEHFLKLPEMAATDLEFFDILLHGGSLLAIVLYFWKDWVRVFQELWMFLKTRRFDSSSLAGKLIVGTIPAVIAGLLFGSAIGHQLRTLGSISLFFMLIAIYFLVAEWKGSKNVGETINIRKALIIGSAQAFALIPGVSRAGTTIATGMLLGIKRQVAAKFSFMLGGVAILAANVYTLFSLQKGAVLPDATFTTIGFATSFVVSLFAIHWLLRFLQEHTLRPFAFYLILVGVLIQMVL